MKKGETNNPNGRPVGSLNKDKQEVQDLAKELGFSAAKIKMLLAMKKFKELGYSKEQIAELTVQEIIEIQSKNANDILPYLHGKRRQVDSNGDDSSDPITELVNAFRNK